MNDCIVRVFGQVLRGKTSGRLVTDQADGSEWLYVYLETPTVIGGVGHPRDVIAVAPRAVEMLG